MLSAAGVQAFADGSESAGPSEPAPPVEAPVLDLVHLARQTFGDHALEVELLTLFDRQAAQFQASFAKPGVPGDAGWRANLAHTLKGSSRAVGAFALGEAAEAYEAALRGGDPGAEPLRLRLSGAIEAVRAALSELLGQVRGEAA